jgi:predicted O-methyltransferase YrrM
VIAISEMRNRAQFGMRSFVSEASLWDPELLVSSGWIEHAPFAFWLMEALKPRLLVELGTHQGYSYFVFNQALKRLGAKTLCFAVDTWHGDEHAGYYGEEIFQRVSAHNSEFYGDFSRLIRSTFDEALVRFQNGTFDLLNIDGCHFY